MNKKKYLLIKRVLDFLFAIILLIIITPILLFVAILIKINSKGPIFFLQDRIGLDGNVFKIIKFRSMYLDSEKEGVYESKNDLRVTQIGRIIRKTSIDELPQLFNIIKGEMSVIGPRPPLTYHPWEYSKYSDDQVKRFLVRPGVTGWAQINGRKDVPWKRRIVYDVFYVENISLFFDIKIFIKTIARVLLMKDNYNKTETV